MGLEVEGETPYCFLNNYLKMCALPLSQTSRLEKLSKTFSNFHLSVSVFPRTGEELYVAEMERRCVTGLEH